jgi:hypothetical protein
MRLTAEDRQFFLEIQQVLVAKRFSGKARCYVDVTFWRIMENPRIARDFAKAAKSPPIR